MEVEFTGYIRLYRRWAYINVPKRLQDKILPGEYVVELYDLDGGLATRYVAKPVSWQNKYVRVYVPARCLAFLSIIKPYRVRLLPVNTAPAAATIAN